MTLHEELQAYRQANVTQLPVVVPQPNGLFVVFMPGGGQHNFSSQTHVDAFMASQRPKE